MLHWAAQRNEAVICKSKPFRIFAGTYNKYDDLHFAFASVSGFGVDVVGFARLRVGWRNWWSWAPECSGLKVCSPSLESR